MRQAAGGEEGAVPRVHGVRVRRGDHRGDGHFGGAEELPQCDLPVSVVLISVVRVHPSHSFITHHSSHHITHHIIHHSSHHITHYITHHITSHITSHSSHHSSHHSSLITHHITRLKYTLTPSGAFPSASCSTTRSSTCPSRVTAATSTSNPRSATASPSRWRSSTSSSLPLPALTVRTVRSPISAMRSSPPRARVSRSTRSRAGPAVPPPSPPIATMRAGITCHCTWR